MDVGFSGIHLWTKVRLYLETRCSCRYCPASFFESHYLLYLIEVLQKVNELLEKLNWTDHTNHGSKIEVVYVASGAQHVETQINIENPPKQPTTNPEKEQPLPNPLQKEREPRLPEVLATEEAVEIWKKVQGAGYVDAHYQPLLSRTQSALLADAIAERLGIREKWKTFETLWNRKNMYRDYYQALDQRKTLFFRDDIKKVLA